ncbi:DeoR family transcriptional regulator [Streptomyces sp. NPDC006367]|uniref:DeoR family transcriptional regulator n=1 Tax=unclassified Streptomyces TaxID=2593676 RepID=UPI0033B743A4
MHAGERHRAILRRLREHGSLRVADLADELSVSAVAVRRDVAAPAGPPGPGHRLSVLSEPRVRDSTA